MWVCSKWCALGERRGGVGEQPSRWCTMFFFTSSVGNKWRACEWVQTPGTRLADLLRLPVAVVIATAISCRSLWNNYCWFHLQSPGLLPSAAGALECAWKFHWNLVSAVGALQGLPRPTTSSASNAASPKLQKDWRFAFIQFEVLRWVNLTLYSVTLTYHKLVEVGSAFHFSDAVLL